MIMMMMVLAMTIKMTVMAAITNVDRDDNEDGDNDYNDHGNNNHKDGHVMLAWCKLDMTLMWLVTVNDDVASEKILLENTTSMY